MAQNAVAPDHDRLTCADGYVLDAPCRRDVYKRQIEGQLKELYDKKTELENLEIINTCLLYTSRCV